MATVDTSAIQGSQFIGCPITVPVVSATVAGSPTFRRVRLKVTVNNTETFEFSTPVAGNGETWLCDISSAIQAVAELYEYEADAETISYPTYSVKLNAYDDYMIDGQNYEGMDPHEYPISGYFYIGKLTDRERLSGARPSRYSRKPTTGTEVIFIGTTYMMGVSTTEEVQGEIINNPPAVTRTAVTASTQLANTYVVPMPADGYELRFINSLGVHESLCIRSLVAQEVPIETNEYVVAKQETLTSFSRSVSKKQNDQEVWEMSSGALDVEWLKYYLHEVLMAEIAWLKVGGLWLSVEIIPDETTPGVDRTKSDILEVKFKLKFGINGPVN